jgi:Rrf2 family protein
MRVSARADYALRACVHLASTPSDSIIKAEAIANEQNIPLRFLLSILAELRRARVVESRRGSDGGYRLSRPASQIAVGEVIRVIDGPLANVRDTRLGDLDYPEETAALETLWQAVRASLRLVLDEVTVAEVASGRLPARIEALAKAYRAEQG